MYNYLSFSSSLLAAGLFHAYLITKKVCHTYVCDRLNVLNVFSNGKGSNFFLRTVKYIVLANDELHPRLTSLLGGGKMALTVS